MIPRRRLIAFLLVAVAVTMGIVAGFVWRIESRFIYTRWFHDRRFGIEYGLEVSSDGTKHRILNTSFYYPPALIVGIKSFRIPDSRTPSFRIVSDSVNDLHCVYDTLGWGYLALIDTSTDNCLYFCTSGTQSPAADSSQWRAKFDALLKLYPEIPYSDALRDEESEDKGNAG